MLNPMPGRLTRLGNRLGEGTFRYGFHCSLGLRQHLQWANRLTLQGHDATKTRAHHSSQRSKSPGYPTRLSIRADARSLMVAIPDWFYLVSS